MEKHEFAVELQRLAVGHGVTLQVARVDALWSWYGRHLDLTTWVDAVGRLLCEPRWPSQAMLAKVIEQTKEGHRKKHKTDDDEKKFAPMSREQRRYNAFRMNLLGQQLTRKMSPIEVKAALQQAIEHWPEHAEALRKEISGGVFEIDNVKREIGPVDEHGPDLWTEPAPPLSTEEQRDRSDIAAAIGLAAEIAAKSRRQPALAPAPREPGELDPDEVAEIERTEELERVASPAGAAPPSAEHDGATDVSPMPEKRSHGAPSDSGAPDV